MTLRAWLIFPERTPQTTLQEGLAAHLRLDS